MTGPATPPYPLPCPSCGTAESDCLSLALTSENGEPDNCCSACDHPLGNAPRREDQS